MEQRIVVTGIGLVTPVGNDRPTTWAALCRGTSGVGPITRYDASRHRVKIAAEVKAFDPAPYLAGEVPTPYDPGVAYGLAALREALAQAQLDVSAYADEIGVCIGSGKGGVTSLHTHFYTLLEGNPAMLPPTTYPQINQSSFAGALALQSGARGPSFVTVSACASSANAIGEAAEMIRRGDALAMIAGGVEAGITPLPMAAFANMGALSQRNDDPIHASRPFDAARDGFVLGEGAAILILEDLAFARARGAPILGEIAGYCATADAHHITEPDPAGQGIQRAMRQALAKGGIAPEAIGYINAHGTATPLNDRTETAAIRAVFGAHADRLMVSSTKSMIGHTMGAAGAIETAVTLLSLASGIVTPTMNLTEPDPACDLDYVPNAARQAPIEYALSNSMGFGGHNASLLLRRAENEG
jgi:3-oxoacyl-[acyl-carrier-protein] synthase II